MTFDTLDLFAGPGGWSEAVKRLGWTELGVEWDEAACATARAAGHGRLQADVAELDPQQFSGVRRVIASPPCPTFSAAGNGNGRHLIEIIVRCLRELADGLDTRAERTAEAYEALMPVAWADEQARAGRRGTEPDREKARQRAQRDAHTSLLVVEPLRYVLALNPEAVALEQVKEVLPVWKVIREILEARGYSAWTGILEAERYGVPQTRERAFMLASRSGMAHPPVPTHQRYVPSEPRWDGPLITLEGELLPWVSMADALAMTAGVHPRPAPTVTGGGTASGGPEVFGSRGRELVRGAVAMRAGARDRQAVRHENEPAATIVGGHDTARRVWVDAENPDDPGPVEAWTEQRPATNVNGDPRVAAPGRHDPAQSGSQYGAGTVRVTVEEAAALQTFPPDYPWQGSRTAQFQQIGNAVPPLLAEAVLRTLA